MVRVPCAVRLISVWPSQSLDGVRVRGAALFLDGIEPLWEVHVLQHTMYVRGATDNGCTCHATYASAHCIDGFEPLWESATRLDAQPPRKAIRGGAGCFLAQLLA